MIVSIVVICGVFVALVISACAMVNKENSDGENNCQGCPYGDLCRRKSKEEKY